MSPSSLTALACLSPGVIASTLAVLRAVEKPFVGALAWDLGYDKPTRVALGYDQNLEDRLLGGLDWRADGYELFLHSAQAKSSRIGFLGGLPPKLSYFAMRRAAFLQLGGFDERFRSPGGGFVNHDFLKRAVEQGGLDFVTLLGEGCFHQFHGGVTSAAPPDDPPQPAFAEEYGRIHDKPYELFAQLKVRYFGGLLEPAWRFIAGPVKNARRREAKAGGSR